MISAVVPSRKPLKSSVSPIPSVSIRFETPALQRFSQRQRHFAHLRVRGQAQAQATMAEIPRELQDTLTSGGADAPATLTSGGRPRRARQAPAPAAPPPPAAAATNQQRRVWGRAGSVLRGEARPGCFEGEPSGRCHRPGPSAWLHRRTTGLHAAAPSAAGSGGGGWRAEVRSGLDVYRDGDGRCGGIRSLSGESDPQDLRSFSGARIDRKLNLENQKLGGEPEVPAAAQAELEGARGRENGWHARTACGP